MDTTPGDGQSEPNTLSQGNESQGQPAQSSTPPIPPAPSQWAYNPYSGESDRPQGASRPPSSQASYVASTKPSASFTIQRLLQSYRAVLTRPGLATFDAELPAANWQAVWFGAGCLAAAWTLVVIIASLMSAMSYSSGLSFGTVVGSFAIFLIGFFGGVGLYHLIARLFGGTGSFLTYAYAISLVIAPLDVIGALVFIIPVVGVLVLLAVGGYSIFLLVLATQSAHRLTVGKAVAVILIPSAAAVIIYCALFALIASFLILLLSGTHATP